MEKIALRYISYAACDGGITVSDVIEHSIEDKINSIKRTYPDAICIGKDFQDREMNWYSDSKKVFIKIIEAVEKVGE